MPPRRGPLAGLTLPNGEGFSVLQTPDAARFILRGNPAAVAAFGPATPEPLRASHLPLEKRVALWLGPDEFLLLAPNEDAAAIAPQLEQLLGSEPHALVDVSHRQLGLGLEGRLAARCLSAGCPLDLRLSAFPLGMVARTIFLKTEIVLWRQAEERFHLEISRSFAPYLIGHLAEAYAGTSGL